MGRHAAPKRIVNGHSVPPRAASETMEARGSHPSATPARATIVRVAIVGLFVIAVIHTLDFAHAVAIPIVAAMLLATVLSPIVEYLEQHRVPAALGAAMLLIALVAIVALVARAIAQPLFEWLEYIPDTLGTLWSEFVHWWMGLSVKMGLSTARAANAPVPPGFAVQSLSLTGALMAAVEKIVAGAIAALILLYFILSSPSLFTLKLMRVLPRLRDKVRAVEIIGTVRREVGVYFLTITLINIGLGIATSVLMYLLGMPTPMLWGVMATLFNFVPYLGPGCGLIVLTLAAFHTFDSAGSILAVPVAFFVLIVLEGQVLSPLIVGRRLQCNPVVVFLSLTVWGWIWGVAGLIVAVPLLVVLKTFSNHIAALTPLAEFLSPD